MADKETNDIKENDTSLMIGDKLKVPKDLTLDFGAFYMAEPLLKGIATEGTTFFEYKAFLLILANIYQALFSEYYEIKLDSRLLAKYLGKNVDDNTELKYINLYLRQRLGNICQHFGYTLQSNENFGAGTIITDIRIEKVGFTYFSINPKILPFVKFESEYRIYTLWADDFQHFHNFRCFYFYRYLRIHSDTRRINKRSIFLSELKEIFFLDDDEYMDKKVIKNKNNVTNTLYYFNISAFEKRVLNPICNTMTLTTVMSLRTIGSDYYLKDIAFNSKINAREERYTFEWEYNIDNFLSGASNTDTNTNTIANTTTDTNTDTTTEEPYIKSKKQLLREKKVKEIIDKTEPNPQYFSGLFDIDCEKSIENKQNYYRNYEYGYKKQNQFTNFKQREMTDDDFKELEKSFYLTGVANRGITKPDTD